jgi:hypothetical protein
MCKARVFLPEELVIKELTSKERVETFNRWLASTEGRRKFNRILGDSKKRTDRLQTHSTEDSE